MREVSLDMVKIDESLDISEKVLIPAVEAKDETSAVTRMEDTENNTNQVLYDYESCYRNSDYLRIYS